MAGDAHVDESQFKGISKYFNSTTSTGRANVSLMHFFESMNFSQLLTRIFMKRVMLITVWVEI
jgi:hypothetical protein